VLVGRDVEVARIEQLLDDARHGRSGALAITGEPGIGKTALWRAAIELADDLVILSARGVAAESELPFAGLAELFAGVLELVATLPERQCAAMTGALALGPPAGIDPLAVGVATLGLLSAVAERGPVLCAIDDLQWVDASSVQAITFAARRLQAEGVAMLLTRRLEDEVSAPLLDLDTLVLAGLSSDAASELLLAAAGTQVDDEVAQWLHESTGGNPLALVELPALLSAGQLGGSEPIEDPMPPGPTTERAFRRRIAEFNQDTRDALLLAAASGSGDLDAVVVALEMLGIPTAALEASSSGARCFDLPPTTERLRLSDVEPIRHSRTRSPRATSDDRGISPAHRSARTLRSPMPSRPPESTLAGAAPTPGRRGRCSERLN